ncbi:MAG: hypothetical protein ACUVTM_04845 [Candidatus Bathyarchaeia archaeon]
MSLRRTVRFLNVNDHDIYPVPDIDSIVRIGKIPKATGRGEYWFPVWRISRRYDDSQVATILRMLKGRLGKFAVAFINDENYLVMSDKALDEDYANEILSAVMVLREKPRRLHLSKESV